jgi:uncharacterized protein with ParB-like and HNH nuclease domain
MSSLDHKTRSIGELVAEYRQGKLVIPEFQREYVWQPRKAPIELHQTETAPM